MKIDKCPFCNRKLKINYYGHPDFFKYLKEMAHIHSIKNRDYSASDTDPFRNFRMSELIGIPAWKGALIRLGDKFIRINNLALKGKAAVVDEKITDTLIDMGVYALIVRILYEEENAKQNEDNTGRP